MQSFCKNFHGVGIMISGNLGSFALRSKLPFHGKGTITDFLQQTTSYSKGSSFLLLLKCFSCAPLASGHGLGMQTDSLTSCNSIPPILSFYNNLWQGSFRSGTVGLGFPVRCITTMDESKKSLVEDGSSTIPDVAPRVKFKRPDKTAKHIMQILDKEAVEQVRTARDIPDIRPGYIIQLKVEVPQNKRRVSLLKGIVIARRNAGLNTTFRLRRLVAGVGVESVYPLYSPNIKEIKVLDKHEVRRAKLYYLRDRMNPLKK